MNRKDYVLAMMAASKGAAFEPVHVQKFMFLLDKKVAGLVGGPYFNFTPYDYGPFDHNVYSELENLAGDELVHIDCAPGMGRRLYRLSPEGQEKGDSILKEMSPDVYRYVATLSEWIRTQPFDRLVAWIYKEYPDMKVNSVFRG
jgi:uncharacterized protein